MRPFGKIAGYAGALYGALQLLGAAAIGSLVAHLHEKTPVPAGNHFYSLCSDCFNSICQRLGAKLMTDSKEITVRYYQDVVDDS